MDYSRPGFPVHHHLPEVDQTHVHRVGDAIQPSHPLSSPSPPALNLSQHQGLFQGVNSSLQVAKELELKFSFSVSPSSEYSGFISFRIDTFELWCWRRLWRVPWTASRSNQSILKEINHEYSLEGLTLKLNFSSNSLAT